MSLFGAFADTVIFGTLGTIRRLFDSSFLTVVKSRFVKQDAHYHFDEYHPLPVPEWSKEKSESYKINHQVDFESLIGLLEEELANSLEALRYDIVENILQFYRYYKKEKYGTFLEKYKRYEPTLPPENHDCIGLVLELHKSFRKLEEKFPNISNHFFLASCQENLEHIQQYTQYLTEVFEFKDFESDCQKLKSFDKEHVVLCFKFELVFSRRKGTIVFDPGFHVGEVVVVMEDGLSPHTGWFIQKEDTNFRKLYEYSYAEGTQDFINWNEKTRDNETEINVINVIYTGRPYLSYLEVTEKRNLVYFFKSIISRDKRGHILAGIYFKIELEDELFTILYDKNGKRRMRLDFKDIKSDFEQIDKSVCNHLEICSEQMKMPLEKLVRILLEVKEMVFDKDFVKGLLEIEEHITGKISGIWSLEDPDHVYSP